MQIIAHVDDGILVKLSDQEAKALAGQRHSWDDHLRADGYGGKVKTGIVIETKEVVEALNKQHDLRWRLEQAIDATKAATKAFEELHIHMTTAVPAKARGYFLVAPGAKLEAIAVPESKR